MDIKIYNDPWKHVVIDNFLPDNIYNELMENREDFIELYKQTYHTTTHHFAWNYQKDHYSHGVNALNPNKFHKYVKQFPNLESCYLNLYNFFSDTHDSFIKDVYSIFHNDYPERFSYSVQIQNKDYQYKIHTDSMRKKITTLVYLSEKNIGTYLYKSKDQDYNKPTKEVEWKPNRAMVFTRENCWHSFQSSKTDGFRYTLNYNLME